MRRLARMRSYQKRSHYSITDKEGSTYDGYSEPTSIKATIWPASGQVQAMQYGQKLAYIMNMIVEADESISENDGIHVYQLDVSKDPDYKVISIQSFSGHKVIQLEKI